MKRALILAIYSATLSATGCLHPRIGPRSLPRDRADYSLSLSDSWKEQTLLNIVKFRYIDPPVFVDVGSIISSYTLAQNASIGGTFQPSSTNSATVGGTVGFSSSPTITYTPLTGNAYIKSLLTPLPPLLVFAAIQNGAPADMILLSSVTSINGLRNQSVGLSGIKPPDPDFLRVRDLLRDIQDSGAVRIYTKVDAKNGDTDIITLRTNNIPPEIQANVVELRHLLHLNPEATELKLVPAPLPSTDTELAVQTRSIEELLFNLAAEVEVPSEDVDHHRAIPGFESGRDVPGVTRMIRIHSARKKPENSFVSVYYRNTWFWIEDGDLISKRALAQLMRLFTMADTGSRQGQPVLTVPTR